MGNRFRFFDLNTAPPVISWRVALVSQCLTVFGRHKRHLVARRSVVLGVEHPHSCRDVAVRPEVIQLGGVQPDRLPSGPVVVTARSPARRPSAVNDAVLPHAANPVSRSPELYLHANIIAVGSCYTYTTVTVERAVSETRNVHGDRMGFLKR